MIQETNKRLHLKSYDNQQDKIDDLNFYAWEIRRSNPNESLSISKDAFDLSIELEYQSGIAFSLKNSGTAYYLISNYELGVHDLNKSRNIFREIGDKKSEADCLRYLGNIYHSIEEFDLSIDLYEKAKLLSTDIDDKIGIAYNLGNIGFVYFLRNNFIEAQDYLFKTYELLFDIDDTLGLADVLNNIGKNHFELNEIEQSLKCYRISLNLSISIKHLRGIANSFNNIGLYYLHTKDVKQSIHYFTNALDVAQEMGELALISVVYKNISQSYELSKDYENSLFYYKKHDSVKLEILKTSNINRIIALQVQFDLDQVESEKEIINFKRTEFNNFQNESIEEKTKLELLSLVASQSDNVVIIMDAFGEINFVNDSFIRLNDAGLLRVKEFKGKTIFDISNHPNIRDLVEECISLKKSVSYESLNVSFEGEKFWGSALLTPVFNDNNDLTNLIIVENDISERKKAEEIIDQKNQDITSSITYAKRIQDAMFPSKSRINENFIDSFIINEPKDIVSGDFYWFDLIGDHVTFAVADCTGHGVPGAFMSMIGMNLLTQITNDSSVTNPSKVLNNLDERIKKALKQIGDVNETTDGMDIAFFEFSLKESLNSDVVNLNFSSAYRPLWLMRDNQLIEIKPDKLSIGGNVTSTKVFTNNTIETQKGDIFYVFTDGCIDQFGGVNGKKFRTNGLQNLLYEIHHLPMEEQEKIISLTLNNWKGDLEQVDDILIMGFKIK